jgi:hypothetical protein
MGQDRARRDAAAVEALQAVLFAQGQPEQIAVQVGNGLAPPGTAVAVTSRPSMYSQGGGNAMSKRKTKQPPLGF